MKNTNPPTHHPMSGPPGRPPAPAVTTVSAILSRDIGQQVGVLKHGEAAAAAAVARAAGVPLPATAEAATAGDAPAPEAPKSGSLPRAIPDLPNQTAGTLPNNSVPVATLEKDALAALAARGGRGLRAATETWRGSRSLRASGWDRRDGTARPFP